MLLELNNIYVANNFIKPTLIFYIMHEGITFLFRNTYYNIRLIKGNLSKQKSLLNLTPIVICSHGPKNV
jgi:hypothetical protein